MQLRASRVACLALAFVGLLGQSGRGQSPAAAPTLGEIDQLRLQALELTIENLTLRLDAVRRETDRYLRSLDKPGYVLSRQRQSDGSMRWVYQPVGDNQ